MTISFTGSFQDFVETTFVSVDPADTYLHTNSDPLAGDAVAIDLSALGLSAGMLVQFNVVEETYFDGTSDVYPVMGGVFSATSTIDAASNLNRIPGAVAPPFYEPFVSQSTKFGGQSTDISQDLVLGGEEDPAVVIPSGAQYLFVTVDDDFFGDNTTTSPDFGFMVFAPLLVGFDGAGTLNVTNEGSLASPAYLPALGVGGQGYTGTANISNSFVNIA